MSMPKKRGRPSGAKTIKNQSEVTPSRCGQCGSSRRSDYQNTYHRDYSGAGLPFVGITYRSCRCLDCGQARRDLEKVYKARISV
jgi:hypothetical protein